MAKSRDAFRTISEVSDWLDTPAHVLRFWESKFTQIKPVKRAGGRRYYRPQDMALLGGIKTLLHDQGMTIKGAQKLLRDKGIKHVSALGPQPGDTSETSLEGIAIDVTPNDQPALETKSAQTDVPDAVTAEPESAAATEDDLWPADPQDAPTIDINDDIRADQSADTQTPADTAADDVADAPSARPDRSIPALPDSAAAQARPGWLAVVTAADTDVVRKNMAAITPLATKLAEVHNRMSAA